mmetsp:Transcript_26424/g.74358  ORF Transcript_26424/g.74358 Transcript_26424/m.74358 type:complete len:357 (-) Transcript_26424:595-1665(-)
MTSLALFWERSLTMPRATIPRGQPLRWRREREPWVARAVRPCPLPVTRAHCVRLSSRRSGRAARKGRPLSVTSDCWMLRLLRVLQLLRCCAPTSVISQPPMSSAVRWGRPEKISAPRSLTVEPATARVLRGIAVARSSTPASLKRQQKFRSRCVREGSLATASSPSRPMSQLLRVRLWRALRLDRATRPRPLIHQQCDRTSVWRAVSEVRPVRLASVACLQLPRLSFCRPVRGARDSSSPGACSPRVLRRRSMLVAKGNSSRILSVSRVQGWRCCTLRPWPRRHCRHTLRADFRLTQPLTLWNTFTRTSSGIPSHPELDMARPSGGTRLDSGGPLESRPKMCRTPVFFPGGLERKV